MPRIRINTELEQASVEAALLTTDGAGNPYYLLPGATNTYLKFNGGFLEWSTVAPSVAGPADSVVSTDAANNLVSNNPLMKYDLMYSISSPPKVTALADAGVGASTTLVGSHRAGIISLTTGATVNAGPLVRADFNSILYPWGSSIVLFPHNAQAADVARFIYATGSGGTFVILTNTGISPNTLFEWNYISEGY